MNPARLTLGLVCFIGLVAGAQAQDINRPFPQFYLGASGGVASTDLSGTLDSLFSSMPRDVHYWHEHFGWKAVAGVQFNPSWGAEINYLDFGTTDLRGTYIGMVAGPGGGGVPTLVPTPFPFSAKVDSTGVSYA